jgi:hypothetical protein
MLPVKNQILQVLSDSAAERKDNGTAKAVDYWTRLKKTATFK